MNDKTKIAICAIGSLTILESIALFNGINGVMLSAVIAAISGIGGWRIGKR